MLSPFIREFSELGASWEQEGGGGGRWGEGEPPPSQCTLGAEKQRNCWTVTASQSAYGYVTGSMWILNGRAHTN